MYRHRDNKKIHTQRQKTDTEGYIHKTAFRQAQVQIHAIGRGWKAQEHEVENSNVEFKCGTLSSMAPREKAFISFLNSTWMLY